MYLITFDKKVDTVFDFEQKLAFKGNQLHFLISSHKSYIDIVA